MKRLNFDISNLFCFNCIVFFLYFSSQANEDITQIVEIFNKWDEKWDWLAKNLVRLTSGMQFRLIYIQGNAKQKSTAFFFDELFWKCRKNKEFPNEYLWKPCEHAVRFYSFDFLSQRAVYSSLWLGRHTAWKWPRSWGHVISESSSSTVICTNRSVTPSFTNSNSNRRLF